MALVQKKVAELLGSGRFTMSFQIGMLASFESFLQTAKLRNDDEDTIFDDAEQQRDLTDVEKDGIDVRDVNKLARDFFNTLHYHMPHPKMDAVVASLANSWLTGRKTLVFVRRVASDEIMQVERVLERMNIFLKLMHEGLFVVGAEDKHIDVTIAMARGRRPVEIIREKLRTAFPIKLVDISGDVKVVAVSRALAVEALDRLAALQKLSGEHLGIEWNHSNMGGQLFGTMHLAGGRIQPFTPLLDSLAGRLLVRCISPVGVVDLAASLEAIQDSIRTKPVRLGAVPGPEEGSYNLTVQEDVLLGDLIHDEVRVNGS